MSRRNSPTKRKVAPDKKYNNTHVTMFVNRMMYGGKRSTALAIMYGAFNLIEERAKRDPIEVFEQALRNVTPSVEVVIVPAFPTATNRSARTRPRSH